MQSTLWALLLLFPVSAKQDFKCLKSKKDVINALHDNAEEMMAGLFMLEENEFEIIWPTQMNLMQYCPSLTGAGGYAALAEGMKNICSESYPYIKAQTDRYCMEEKSDTIGYKIGSDRYCGDRMAAIEPEFLEAIKLKYSSITNNCAASQKARDPLWNCGDTLVTSLVNLYSEDMQLNKEMQLSEYINQLGAVMCINADDSSCWTDVVTAYTSGDLESQFSSIIDDPATVCSDTCGLLATKTAFKLGTYLLTDQMGPSGQAWMAAGASVANYACLQPDQYDTATHGDDQYCGTLIAAAVPEFGLSAMARRLQMARGKKLVSQEVRKLAHRFPHVIKNKSRRQLDAHLEKCEPLMTVIQKKWRKRLP